MGDRAAIQRTISLAHEALQLAGAQFDLSMRQEHYNEVEYSAAQQLLETAAIELENLERLAVDEQKDLLFRTRLQVQQLQNEMIINPHFGL